MGARRRPIGVALVSAAILLVGVGQGSAQADVTAVKGSAYGYSCVVTVFGMNCTPSGPTPTVTLASNASNSPQTAFTPSGRADAGPATIFSSGRLDVSTQGTLGPTGSVTSSTNVANLNASGNESLTASSLASSCAASEGAVIGSTAISAGATLQVDEGDDDPTNTIPNHPPVVMTLPASPDPNTSIEGHVHPGNTTDNFRYVLNEQVVGADGAITVSAAHQYLLGPTAVGELIIGQSVCGVTAVTDTTPPQTTIDSGPSGTIPTSSASFEFSSEAGATFQCKLDGPGAVTGTFATCTSPQGYMLLADGFYTFSVQATDAAGNTDASPATRTFTVDTTPPGMADLGIALSDSPDPVAARGQVTYTVDVTNTGPDTATGVTVVTSIPKGARFLSSGGAATCAVVKGKDAGVRCDLGSIASGASKQFTIVVKAGGKPLTATSTVSANTTDPNAANNTDSESTAIAP